VQFEKRHRNDYPCRHVRRNDFQTLARKDLGEKAIDGGAMSTMAGQRSGTRNGRIALAILGFFMRLVVRVTVDSVRRRLVFVGVAVVAVALVSAGLVASLARSASPGA
jgi:hypothetical protein